MLVLILWALWHIVGYFSLAQLYGDAFRSWDSKSLSKHKTRRRLRGLMIIFPALLLGPLSYLVLYVVSVKFDENLEYFWSVVKGKPKYSLSW